MADVLDSRLTEIGTLPLSWEVDRFDALFDVQQGKQVSTKTRVGTNQRRFLRTKNVLWGKFDLNELDEMHFSESDEKRLALQQGDLLICEGGDIGRTAVWDGSVINCHFQNHLHRARLRNTDAANSYFMMYWLWYAFEVGNVYFGRANVTTIPNLAQSRLRELPIPIPPLDEQHKIAAVLSLVQRAIAQQERLIALTTELKKALMHKLFTEGLHGEPQKETEIGLMPESWEVVSLGSIAKIGNGSTPKRDNPSYWENGDLPWLNSTKIHELFIDNADQFVTPLAVSECHLPSVPAGSLLVAITGQGKTLGNSALVTFETHINQHLAYVRFTSEEALPGFVLWYMQTRYEFLRSISQAGGSTKGALTCGYLKTVSVPLPCLAEQSRIAEIINALNTRLRNLNKKKELLQELFSSLLHQLMTAQIRVNDLDLSALEAEVGV